MKSDVIHVTNEGEGVAEAIKQAEAVAALVSFKKRFNSPQSFNRRNDGDDAGSYG